MLKHVRASDEWHEKNNGQKGFTLIELLVVIIILGVLAGIVVLAVNGLKDTGDKNACQTEEKTVQSAAAAYYADHDNTWPSSTGTSGMDKYIDVNELEYAPWAISSTDGTASTNVATPTGCDP